MPLDFQFGFLDGVANATTRALTAVAPLVTELATGTRAAVDVPMFVVLRAGGVSLAGVGGIICERDTACVSSRHRARLKPGAVGRDGDGCGGGKPCKPHAGSTSGALTCMYWDVGHGTWSTAGVTTRRDASTGLGTTTPDGNQDQRSAN